MLQTDHLASDPKVISFVAVSLIHSKMDLLVYVLLKCLLKLRVAKKMIPFKIDWQTELKVVRAPFSREKKTTATIYTAAQFFEEKEGE